MSGLSGLNSLKTRYGFDKMSNWGEVEKNFDTTSDSKVSTRGKRLSGYADPLERIREDKLRSMKRALYNSYQSAIIQFDKDDRVQNEDGTKEGYHFRCLMNHDKLKVDYQDKILSIPYREVPLEFQNNRQMTLVDKMQDTGTPGRALDADGNPLIDPQTGEEVTEPVYRVKPGDTFKWISGNDGYMPNSYWIIFLQYSEQTAYFRGQIRKADDQIEIIPVEEDGSDGDPLIYHGWTVGPNEEQAIWNVKKGVIWNDLYYSKILYITKDQNTMAFFNRFDRVVINGQTWQIYGYNDNYGTSSKNADGGMIRVALKETYTSTNQIIKKQEQEIEQTEQTVILGPAIVQSYDIVKYIANGTREWSLQGGDGLVKILSTTDRRDSNTDEIIGSEIKLQILEVNSQASFDLYYGNDGQVFTVTVKPFK